MKRLDESAPSGSDVALPFPPTLWTVVVEAKHDDPERARKALGELCVHYRGAILGYFLLKSHHRQNAEDLTGDFILRMLDPKHLACFDSDSCPRFRHYLITALKRFFIDGLDKQNAKKRGDGQLTESYEDLCQSGADFPLDDARLNRAVDLGITQLIHNQVMAVLEKKAADPDRFRVLRDFVPFEQTNETYEQAARRLGLSVAALRKAIFDLRKNYAQQFRVAVAPIVRNVRNDVDDEASHLLDLLPEAVALERREGSG
jgi:RNA polymerase sigma-70 factor (ECF subfamily)